MDWRLRVPGGLYRRACEQAGSDADLAALVRTWLERYIDPVPTAQQLGGRASAARLTPAERQEKARRAVEARWTKHRAQTP